MLNVTSKQLAYKLARLAKKKEKIDERINVLKIYIEASMCLNNEKEISSMGWKIELIPSHQRLYIKPTDEVLNALHRANIEITHSDVKSHVRISKES